MVKTRQGLSILTEEHVRMIRAAYGSGKNITQAMLADQYGVSIQAISDVVRRKTYSNVE